MHTVQLCNYDVSYQNYQKSIKYLIGMLPVSWKDLRAGLMCIPFIRISVPTI